MNRIGGRALPLIRMDQAISITTSQAAPLFSQVLDLIRMLVWPVFWIYVIERWKRQIRQLISSLLDMISRIINMKLNAAGASLEIATIAPEGVRGHIVDPPEKVLSPVD
jgi:hypothetical protein